MNSINKLIPLLTLMTIICIIVNQELYPLLNNTHTLKQN